MLSHKITIYRDNEGKVHFAKRHTDDQRLVPIEPTPVWVEIESIQYEGFWATPSAQVGCNGCSLQSPDVHTSCVAMQAALANYNAGCQSIGWDLKYKERPTWEQYRMVGVRQSAVPHMRYSHNYSNYFEKQPSTWYTRIQDVLVKVRPGYKRREQHPAVGYMLEHYGAPKHMGLMVAESPIIPESGDKQQVAYTQNLDKLARDLRTVTKLGRYIKRHWPTLADDVIRNIVARYANIKFEVWKTPTLMIKAVQEGPHSCMKEESWSYDAHPYHAYAPSMGWAVAVGLKDNLIVARAVVNEKRFVRTYHAVDDNPDSTEYGGNSEPMEQWLQDEGYEKLAGWDGFDLKAVSADSSDEYLMPYIDGSAQCVNYNGDTFEISRHGIDATNTSGVVEIDYRAEWEATCEICEEEATDEDCIEYRRRNHSSTSTGYVCYSCGTSYTSVLGCAGDSSSGTYYVPDEDAVEASDGVYVDDKNLPDGYQHLHDGEVANDDDCVYVDREGAYYLTDDTICTKDGNDEVKADCEECDHDGKHHLKEDMAQVDGSYVADCNLEDWLLAKLDEDAREATQELVDSGHWTAQKREMFLAANFDEEDDDEVEVIEPIVPATC